MLLNIFPQPNQPTSQASNQANAKNNKTAKQHKPGAMRGAIESPAPVVYHRGVGVPSRFLKFSSNSSPQPPRILLGRIPFHRPLRTNAHKLPQDGPKTLPRRHATSKDALKTA